MGSIASSGRPRAHLAPPTATMLPSKHGWLAPRDHGSAEACATNNAGKPARSSPPRPTGGRRTATSATMTLSTHADAIAAGIYPIDNGSNDDTVARPMPVAFTRRSVSPDGPAATRPPRNLQRRRRRQRGRPERQGAPVSPPPHRPSDRHPLIVGDQDDVRHHRPGERRHRCRAVARSSLRRRSSTFGASTKNAAANA